MANVADAHAQFENAVRLENTLGRSVRFGRQPDILTHAHEDRGEVGLIEGQGAEVGPGAGRLAVSAVPEEQIAAGNRRGGRERALQRVVVRQGTSLIE